MSFKIEHMLCGVQEPFATFPNLVLSSDEEEFRDCDTSLSNLNLDGQVDEDDLSESGAVASTSNSATMPDPAPLPFDKEDKENDSEAWKMYILTLKLHIVVRLLVNSISFSSYQMILMQNEISE